MRSTSAPLAVSSPMFSVSVGRQKPIFIADLPRGTSTAVGRRPWALARAFDDRHVEVCGAQPVRARLLVLGRVVERFRRLDARKFGDHDTLERDVVSWSKIPSVQPSPAPTHAGGA